jgi:outer membrane immunogenic protein
MIRSTFLAAASSFVLGSVAIAADLPATKGPPIYTPPPPVFSWTGFYIGGQVGYEWGSTSEDPVYNGVLIPLAGPVAPFSHSSGGVTGGGHIGYNFQINQFVIGVEADENGSTYEGSGLLPNGFRLEARERTPLDGSVRGRVGVTFDRALLYATGGLAVGAFDTTLLYPTLGDNLGSASPVRLGWTVGGGIDYAIDNNWAVRVEYRYTDYGRFAENYDSGFYTVNYHPTDNRVQAGFSYLFNPPPPPAPPVVAKY